MKRVLVVSPRFPPVNAADMHRVRQSLPHFREFGWEPTVLAVEPHLCAMPLDPLLERTVPEGARVVRTAALRPGRFGIGNLDLRALPFVARAASRLLAAERFDVVFFSTTAFSLMALGPYWRRRFRVPFVLDLQDPWLSDYYERPNAPEPPGGRIKYTLAQGLARILEPITMHAVSHVIAVSPAYPKILCQRYPWLDVDRFSVLPFGAADLDFDVVRRERVAQSVFDPQDGLDHWVYVGRAGSDMRFSLYALFLALAQARARRSDRFDRVRLHFIGTDYAPPDRARKTVEPVAKECGVADLVMERTSRIPYFEALRCLLDAHALVIPGSDDSAYTASKVNPYILARRPMLAIFHERSSALRVLEETGTAVLVGFRDGEALESVAERIGKAWFRQEPTLGPLNWAAFSRHTAREMTRRQCAIFDSIVDGQARGR